mmetsp:Transcript_12495/g.27881  ORF Transcript_12495/g.27881 Transcript_12495/m.27881 type:complete len:335 (+) Transcript_12495:910-1914(+)
MTEGTLLRLLFLLTLLYPSVVERSGELRFAIRRDHHAHAHMEQTLQELAFGHAGSIADVQRACLSCVPRRHIDLDTDEEQVDAPRTTPCTPSDLGGEHEGIDWDGGIVVESKHVVLAKVATPLWEHQRRAVQAVCDGLQAGKLGFADASSVGAGKTLTALGCVTAVWRRMQTKGLQLRGVLVLLPTQDLILEWELQVEKHLANVRLIVQAATGHLSTKGVAMSGKWGRVDHPVATIVVTTLARAREHPFRNHEGWDFVVVDECLSVQNDTALQTMECWRQVAASSNGVLMLSATFFPIQVFQAVLHDPNATITVAAHSTVPYHLVAGAHCVFRA